MRYIKPLVRFRATALLIILLAVFFPNQWLGATHPEFTEIMPLATKSLLLDLQVLEDKIITVGERGHVLISRDHGISWEQILVPTRVTLTGVYFSNQYQGWIVGHDGVILHTADGGRAWIHQGGDPDPETSYQDVYFLNSKRGFVVGAYGIYRMTNDGGKTWQAEWIDEEELHFNKISQGLDSYLYIAGESGTLLRSLDNGASWKRIDSPYHGSFYGLIFIQDTTMLIYGLRSKVFRTADHAESWKQIPMYPEVLITSGVKIDSGDIILAGLGGNFFISRNQGKSFKHWQISRIKGSAEIASTRDGAIISVGKNGIHRFKPPSESDFFDHCSTPGFNNYKEPLNNHIRFILYSPILQ